MPPRYQTPEMLTDKIMDAMDGEWFTATVIPDSGGDPHVLAARIKLMLTTGPPTARPPPAVAPTIPPATTTSVTPVPAYITDAADKSNPADTDTMSVTIAADDPDEPNRIYDVLKRFRANCTTPYRTDRAFARPARSYRGPGPDNPCHNCQGTDHFAQKSHKLSSISSRPPQGVRFATTVTPVTPNDYVTPPLLTPPPIPPQGPPPREPSGIYLLAASWAVSEPSITTAILDIGSPGDIVGDVWLANNPQATTSPMTPSTTRWAMGNDVPTTLGCVSLRLTTTTKAGSALHVDLPQVHILRHDTVPLLVGLPSHKRLNLVVHTATDTVNFGPAGSPFRAPSSAVTWSSPPVPPPGCPSTPQPSSTRGRNCPWRTANLGTPAWPPSPAPSPHTPFLRRTSPPSRTSPGRASPVKRTRTSPAAPGTPSPHAPWPSTAWWPWTSSN